MPIITAKGRAVAAPLLKHFAPDHHQAIEVACSLLSRLAPAYCRIQELWCSEDLSERPKYQARVEKREASIEARARAIVAGLPESKTGKVELKFTGDPRGYTMRIKVPKAERDGATWGLGGEYGVG